MSRHWIIRSFFIGLLLLCVGVWGWSCATWGGNADDTKIAVFLCYHPGSSLFVGVGGGGRLSFGCETWPFGQPERWTLLLKPLPDRPMPPDYYPHLLGFSMYRHYGWHGNYGRAVDVPFWFPITLSALALFAIWRKTRPTIKPKKAFPVDMAVKEKQA